MRLNAIEEPDLYMKCQACYAVSGNFFFVSGLQQIARALKYFAYFSYTDLRRIPNVIVQKDRIIRGLIARLGKTHVLLRLWQLDRKDFWPIQAVDLVQSQVYHVTGSINVTVPYCMTGVVGTSSHKMRFRN